MKSSSQHTSPRVIMLLYSMPPMPIGGAEIQAIRLIKQLTARKVQTKVITWGKVWHKKKGQYHGVPFTRISSWLNVVTDLASLLKRNKATAPTKIVYDDSKQPNNRMSGKVGWPMILRYQLFYYSCLLYLYFRKNQFDLLHVHMMEWPAVVGVRLGKRLKKPVVIKDSTMNGIINILRYPNGKEKQNQIASYAHCVAMTDAIKRNYLTAGIPEQRIALIPNGIEVKPMVEKQAPVGQTFIFVGNLTQQPAKGIDILLAAWKIIAPQYPSAILQIVGSGDLEAYRSYVAAEGIATSVQFLGKQTEITKLLLEADIFVLPSRREGMSNALMEAMLCAMPIVATDISGNQDLIADGISGLLVPPVNPSKLAEACIFMLQNASKAQSMGIEAYKSVVDKCDIDKVARQYENLYYQILGKN